MTSSIQTKAIRALSVAFVVAVNVACSSVGPDYVRPSIAVPSAYKEAAPGQKPVQPRDSSAQRQWWKIYGDTQLDALVEQVNAANPSIHAAEARVRQARSLADAAKAAQFPTLIAGGTNDLGLLANWELDLWGRIRRNVEASGAAAQASAADLAAAKLSMQAQLVQSYFQLRVQDAEIRLLQDSVAAYERSLQLTRNQYKAGVAARAEVVQAQAQLGAAQAQMLDARVARSQLEHALAVLIGKAPADFSLEVAPINIVVPSVPAALPADLLERRPDIAAAERRMAAASAQIGVAEAASYPLITLFGGQSLRHRVGGEKMTLPLFDAGAIRALSAKAGAAYDEALADYLSTVLNGFREVEDNLAALQFLDEAAQAQAEAVKSARESMTITNNQYRAGIVSYLSLVVVQAGALNNERVALGIFRRRLVASVTLIKALGGGWEANPAKAAKG
ncbi:MAG: efflux transporter outer membrane subunit [Betaproteobacteria bacterium]|nr:efflux transporter outer membrane subunit [Betaproteobacteria bacterium]